MRAAFIPALPPSALLAGMIAPSFRLVNRFCGKKLLRTCGRRERPPALCALFSRSPLACGRVPYPPYARCGMGRLCGERRRRERFERPSGARNAACSTRHRPPPGLPARTSRRVVWRGPQTPPSVFRIQRHARWIRQPCASKATLRRPPPGEVNGAAVDEVGGRRTPGGKDRRQPSFSDALYSIIASASLTSSIRRATCAGVSTGWLNSTVWFTVTAGTAACAACAVWRPS